MNSTFLNLEEYPNAIAALQQELLKLDSLYENCLYEQQKIVSKVEQVIAFQEALKNDSQRKAAKLELLAKDEDYQVSLKELNHFNQKREVAKIHLKQRENEFSILELQKRELIARLENKNYE